MAQRINGFTSGEWYMIRESLLREIRKLEKAIEDITLEAYKTTYEKLRNEYIQLVGKVYHYYNMSGGK